MTLSIRSSFSFRLQQAGAVLLQFEAAQIPEQQVRNGVMGFPDHVQIARIPAQDCIGERVWLFGEGDCVVEYSAKVDVQRLTPEIEGLSALPLHLLPGETVPYLFGSRYCPSDSFEPFVEETMGGTSGGARIAAILDWCDRRLTYRPGTSTSRTTALDTFVQRSGVCRDYTHLVITLARASGIPARYASVYAPDVSPQDFHAVAEVFLADPRGAGGEWLPVDATRMANPAEMAKIGIGRDAADVSFMTSFGPCEFLASSVEVARAQN